MNKFQILSSLLAAAAVLLAACTSNRTPTPTPPAMTGHWKGEARMIVSWATQKTLPIAVEIQSDGKVTGTIGDAELVDGRLEQNRGALGRKLNVATDYIIRGNLDGPIVRAEGITRDSVSMPLNFSGSIFSGGLHTSGSKIGGKDKMVLSATGLELKWQP